jgi:hypothetical protein
MCFVGICYTSHICIVDDFVYYSVDERRFGCDVYNPSSIFTIFVQVVLNKLETYPSLSTTSLFLISQVAQFTNLHVQETTIVKMTVVRS